MTKKGRGAAPIHPGEILLEEFLKSYDPPDGRKLILRRATIKVQVLRDRKSRVEPAST